MNWSFGNWTFHPFVSSPSGRFAPKTFRPLKFPAYSVKTQAPVFGCFNYSCHSVHMSCWIKKSAYLLTYLLSRGRNVHKSILQVYMCVVIPLALEMRPCIPVANRACRSLERQRGVLGYWGRKYWCMHSFSRLFCISQEIGLEDRLRSDLMCQVGLIGPTQRIGLHSFSYHLYQLWRCGVNYDDVGSTVTNCGLLSLIRTLPRNSWPSLVLFGMIDWSIT